MQNNVSPARTVCRPMMGAGGMGVNGTAVAGRTTKVGGGDGGAGVGWLAASVEAASGGVVAVGVPVATTGIVAFPCATASVASHASCVASGTFTPHSP